MDDNNIQSALDLFTRYIQDLSESHSTVNYSFEELYRTGYNMAYSKLAPDFFLHVLRQIREHPSLTDNDLYCISDVLPIFRNKLSIQFFPLFSIVRGQCT